MIESCWRMLVSGFAPFSYCFQLRLKGRHTYYFIILLTSPWLITLFHFLLLITHLCNIYVICTTNKTAFFSNQSCVYYHSIIRKSCFNYNSWVSPGIYPCRVDKLRHPCAATHFALFWSLFLVRRGSRYMCSSLPRDRRILYRLHAHEIIRRFTNSWVIGNNYSNSYLIFGCTDHNV